MSIEHLKVGDEFVAVRKKGWGRQSSQAIADMVVTGVGRRWIHARPKVAGTFPALDLRHNGECPEYPNIRAFPSHEYFKEWASRKERERKLIRAVKHQWRTFEAFVESISDENLDTLIRILTPELRASEES